MIDYFKMGICVRPELNNYWDQRPAYRTLWYGDLMPRDRFTQIHSAFLKLSDIEDEGIYHPKLCASKHLH